MQMHHAADLLAHPMQPTKLGWLRRCTASAGSGSSGHASADAGVQQPDGSRINSYWLSAGGSGTACILAELHAKPVRAAAAGLTSGMPVQDDTV